MRPGITIQHSRDVSGDSAQVRSDIAGLIGVIPKAAWPPGAKRGDFLELPLMATTQLMKSQLRPLFDVVTVRAVRSFFENGGEICHLFGLCVESEHDFMDADPFGTLFFSLLDRLRDREDLGLLLMPILAYLPVAYDQGRPVVGYEGILELLLRHCAEMNNRFLIIDAPRDLHDDDLRGWVMGFRDRHRKLGCYGAIYYPWLMSGDEAFPPSATIAGSFARSDREHAPFGVRWPPANQVLMGVTHPAIEVKWRESGEYTESGVNAILNVPAKGVVAWGARTLSLEPQWRDINTRRIVSFICEQVRRDSEWAVFENQTRELWQIIRRVVTGRLDMLWENGLLAGDRAGAEYLVECSKELNPVEVVDAGIVNVKVRLRPITTAEYIIVDLQLGSS